MKQKIRRNIYIDEDVWEEAKNTFPSVSEEIEKLLRMSLWNNDKTAYDKIKYLQTLKEEISSSLDEKIEKLQEIKTKKTKRENIQNLAWKELLDPNSWRSEIFLKQCCDDLGVTLESINKVFDIIFDDDIPAYEIDDWKVARDKFKDILVEA